MDPGLSGVDRFIDAVSVRRHLAADRRFARADVEDVRVPGIDRDVADGACVESLVADVVPGLAAVRRLPHPAARGAHVIGQLVSGHADAGRRATTVEGADVAEVEIVQQRAVVSRLRPPRLRRRDGQGHAQGAQRRQEKSRKLSHEHPRRPALLLVGVPAAAGPDRSGDAHAPLGGTQKREAMPADSSPSRSGTASQLTGAA